MSVNGWHVGPVFSETKKQLPTAIMAIALIAGLLITVLPAQSANAAQIVSRKLTLEAGATDGGSLPGGVVKHFFEFTLPGGSDVGSIKFEYCTIASGTCTMPTNLDTTSATLDNENGATGFTIDNDDPGVPYLTRTAASVGTNQAVSYRLGNITNPDTEGTFFVRITTHLATDGTGPILDSGTVTASTAEAIILTGTMPESLIFCTGATIPVVSTIPDCSGATAGTVTFNQLFSPTDTATAESQMAASTNANNGYNITVSGTTMSSGSNIITALASATAGIRGTSQFGMNLKANTVLTSTPAVGDEISPVSGAADMQGKASTGYDTVDTFKFADGDSVAKSDFDGTSGPTNSQLYTASYIVNVSGAQPAGTYTTTLTYICTATF